MFALTANRLGGVLKGRRTVRGADILRCVALSSAVSPAEERSFDAMVRQARGNTRKNQRLRDSGRLPGVLYGVDGIRDEDLAAEEELDGVFQACRQHVGQL